ncbi:MAG: hypothetical protein LBM92_08845 [Opitutaceae bacterium]|jgi:hypothetical protein|nr:hypothetical protein [Opitutaceae bacterium]
MNPPMPQQWDIIRFRIRPNDRDLHPGIVLSPVELCESGHIDRLNVLAGSKRVPRDDVRAFQVVLNGADGLEFQTTVDCRFFHIVTKSSVHGIIGRVTAMRRRAIARKINEVFRMPL